MFCSVFGVKGLHICGATPRQTLAWIGLAAIIGALNISCSTPASVDGGGLDVAEFEGTLVPVREAEITPIVNGWLRKIDFAPGQFVAEGDVLFEFAKPPAEYRLQLATAQRDVAAAQLLEAIADVKRSETLRERDVISDVELEKNEALQAIAAANVAAAEANVGLARLGVMQMTLKAPFDGVMSAPLVRENGWQDIGNGNIAMAFITQLDPIQVRGEVPYDIYAARQKLFAFDEALIDGLVFSIALPDGTLYPHDVTLVSGGHEFEEGTQTITVWTEYPNTDRFLRPGLRVAVQSRLKGG
ncbi:efflux RND transporter periplasmic adaptor subunit [Poseidonocella sp. HB161398]|uniref:efflux RND transporter periplasmic adaptor subunit n=1 Tax=Poseidonocella sp. HB161398 TaxID=2320855 RepID=UPI001107F617|nr:efflux RND transporter periplasmic adaptor subunit [Poseidonocella sp. HB161398]